MVTNIKVAGELVVEVVGKCSHPKYTLKVEPTEVKKKKSHIPEKLLILIYSKQTGTLLK